MRQYKLKEKRQKNLHKASEKAKTERKINSKYRQVKKAINGLEPRFISDPPATAEELQTLMMERGFQLIQVLSFVRHEYTNYDKMCNSFYDRFSVAYTEEVKSRVHVQYRKLIRPYLNDLGWNWSLREKDLLDKS